MPPHLHLPCTYVLIVSWSGNWRKSLADALEAKAQDPSNIKSHFRAARAALKLKEWEQCVQLCAEGQAADLQAPEFKQILKVWVQGAGWISALRG